MDQRPPIAILFFSRSAENESAHKRWLGRKDCDRAVALHLIHYTKEHLAATGLPVFHFDESIQQGDSFGERLANAFQQVFNLGYESVISVGNDARGLASLDWESTIAALKSGQNVLGPDKRKGVYLIGLTKDTYNKKTFQDLSWQTNYIFDELNEYCKNPFLLEKKRDINSLHDLRLEIRQDAQLKNLVALLKTPNTGTSHSCKFSVQQALPVIENLRAPPAQAA